MIFAICETFCRLGIWEVPACLQHVRFWWYRVVHAQWTLNYLFTQIWQLHQNARSQTWICVRQGWVCGCCPFSILCKTSTPFFWMIFTGISWDFDNLSTKTRHAPYNVWSSKHPPAGCTLDGNVIVTDQKDTLLLRVAPLRNNWGPRCVIFRLSSMFGQSFSFFTFFFFFFYPSRTSFFSSNVGQVVFFLLCVGQVFLFFYFTFEWFKFFFYTKTSCSSLEV